MAFLQPQQRPRDTQQLSFPTPAQSAAEASQSSSCNQRKRLFEESEEWVLFSPIAIQSDQCSNRSSTEQTPTTVAQTRLSDFGSLETLGRSEQNIFPVAGEDGVAHHGVEAGELDSLDNGLHEFHELVGHAEPDHRHEGFHATVLPSHDGYGLFQPRSAAVQEQIWQIERRQNVRRMNRGRTSSLQVGLDAMHESIGERDQEEETRIRVEKWRLEQSRTLLEEIHRETRRLRSWSRTGSRARVDSLRERRSVGLGPIASKRTASCTSHANSTLEEHGSEGLLSRFTRRVIRDLLEMNDDVLALIFGEDYIPEDVKDEGPTAAASSGNILLRRDTSLFGSKAWQVRLLERIARELGTLVHQLCQHPGSFNTYLQTQEVPPYVGSTIVMHRGHVPVSDTLDEQQQDEWSGSNSKTAAFFSPTLPNQQVINNDNDTSIWGVEEDGPDKGNTTYRNAEVEAKALRQEREYWERELDIKMVFGFFRNRFSSRNTSPSREPWALNAPPAGSQMTASATSPVGAPTSSQLHQTFHAASALTQRRRPAPTYVPAHRAAIIRQQHPLTSTARRRDLLTRPSHRQAAAMATVGVQRRHQSRGSSCASQSSRKSRRTESSCNYWDIGSSSVGSGPAANVGVWGEV